MRTSLITTPLLMLGALAAPDLGHAQGSPDPIPLVQHHLSARITLADQRAWCDQTTYPYRYTCDQGAAIGLPHARVEVREFGTDDHLATARTDDDGDLDLDFWYPRASGDPAPRVYLEVDWTGRPRGAYDSFKVYFNPISSSPSAVANAIDDLETLTWRSPSRRCFGTTCAMGVNTIDFSGETEMAWLAATYLTLDYIYSDALYVYDYHDYCHINGCAGRDHAIIAVYDRTQTGGYPQTGSVTSIMTLIGQRADGIDVFHEFGHALQMWGSDLQPGTIGGASIQEGWASFVSLAYRFDRDAAQVYDDNGSNGASDPDIENDPPTCADGSPVGATPPAGCDAFLHGLNNRKALWDLYDTHQETTVEACEVPGAWSYTGDNMFVAFEDMVAAWGGFLTCAEPTDNHCIFEDQGQTDPSTRNLYDYIYNLQIVAAGAALPQYTQTALNHHCLDAIPTH